MHRTSIENEDAPDIDLEGFDFDQGYDGFQNNDDDGFGGFQASSYQRISIDDMQEDDGVRRSVNASPGHSENVIISTAEFLGNTDPHRAAVGMVRAVDVQPIHDFGNKQGFFGGGNGASVLHPSAIDTLDMQLPGKDKAWAASGAPLATQPMAQVGFSGLSLDSDKEEFIEEDLPFPGMSTGFSSIDVNSFPSMLDSDLQLPGLGALGPPSPAVQTSFELKVDSIEHAVKTVEKALESLRVRDFASLVDDNTQTQRHLITGLTWEGCKAVQFELDVGFEENGRCSVIFRRGRGECFASSKLFERIRHELTGAPICADPWALPGACDMCRYSFTPTSANHYVNLLKVCMQQEIVADTLETLVQATEQIENAHIIGRVGGVIGACAKYIGAEQPAALVRNALVTLINLTKVNGFNYALQNDRDFIQNIRSCAKHVRQECVFQCQRLIEAAVLRIND